MTARRPADPVHACARRLPRAACGLLLLALGGGWARPALAAVPRIPPAAPPALVEVGQAPRLAAPPLDAAALRRAVALLRGALTACATRAAKAAGGPVELGRATLSLTVEPTGAVSRSDLAQPGLRASPLGRCLAAAGRRLVLPPFGGEAVDVELPLRLAAR